MRFKELKRILLSARWLITLEGEGHGTDFIFTDKEMLIIEWDAHYEEAEIYGAIEAKLSKKEYRLLMEAIIDVIDNKMQKIWENEYFLGPYITIYRTK